MSPALSRAARRAYLISQSGPFSVYISKRNHRSLTRGVTLWDIDVPFGTVIIYNIRQVTVSRPILSLDSFLFFSLTLPLSFSLFLFDPLLLSRFSPRAKLLMNIGPKYQSTGIRRRGFIGARRCICPYIKGVYTPRFPSR